ncbi:DUF4386 family protein [bacterium]|nr:MAG: DUF4386 family protein [bacterium]
MKTDSFINLSEQPKRFRLIPFAGFAALFNAATYVLGLSVLFLLFTPLIDEKLSTLEKVQFLLEQKIGYQNWILVIYIAFGSALVFLTLGLHHMFKKTSSELNSVSTAFGLMWALLVLASGMIVNVGLDSVDALFTSNPEQATQLWLAVEAIHQGIGGGIELVGGVWVVLLSLIAIKHHIFSKTLNYLGLITGFIGCITVLPTLGFLGALFALFQIIWFIWLGLSLIKMK